MSRDERKAQLIKHGLSSEAADEYLNYWDKHDAQLSRLECPKCGGKLTKKLDPRQAGIRPGGTTWFNYRCSSCKYLCDKAEAEN